jgi:Domain of unknown function (DU1801)
MPVCHGDRGAMAELKTQRTDADVGEFLAGITDEGRRADAVAVCSMMQEVTGEQPAMWGSSIVGFGINRYRTGRGKEAEWFVTGFSPRKQNLTLYLMDGFEAYDDLLGRLGRHSTGKACLYVKRLSDVDLAVLRQLVQGSVDHVRATSIDRDDSS